MNSCFVFQILVLLQCSRCSSWKTAQVQRYEHEQPEEALQSGHGSSGSHLTGQKPLGENQRQTHNRGNTHSFIHSKIYKELSVGQTFRAVFFNDALMITGFTKQITDSRCCSFVCHIHITDSCSDFHSDVFFLPSVTPLFRLLNNTASLCSTSVAVVLISSSETFSFFCYCLLLFPAARFISI